MRIASNRLAALVPALVSCCLLACGAPPVEEAHPAQEERTSQAATAPSERPPIVLISIDTLRSDRLPIYGYSGVETPAIDGLAADGLVYERAYTHVPLTLPAHVSLFTGLLPPAHGVRDNIGYRFEATGLPYLPRELKAAGYATAAAVSAVVLRGAEGGLTTGFDLYDDAVGEQGRRGAGGVQRSGDDSLAAVLPWLAERRPGEPFFLFLHLFEPHTPYEPPPPFDRYALAYDGEIATADAVVGRLLDALRDADLYDGALIALLSDHGEGLGDHGEDEHGVLLYREAIQVPLVVKLPAQEGAGGRIETPVGLVDVAPTLLEQVGLEVPNGLDGHPLPTSDAPADEPARAIYAETFYPRLHFGWSELTSLVEGRHHYIHGPDPELYDLVADPAEVQDLLRRERGVTRRLRDLLTKLERDPEAPIEVSAEERRSLAALGYVDTSVEVGGGPLPDPKSRLATVGDLVDCLRHYGAGEIVAAEAACLRAVVVDPGSLDAWEHLGRSRQELGRGGDALEAYARALGLANGRASHLALASALLWIEAGRGDHALWLLEHEIPLTAAVIPGSERPLRLLEARTLAQVGRMDEAWSRAMALTEEDPSDADALYLRGAVRIGRGELGEAEEDLSRALDLAPGHTAALSDLATLLVHQGRYGEARDLFEKVLELRPGDPLASEGLRRLSGQP